MPFAVKLYDDAIRESFLQNSALTSAPALPRPLAGFSNLFVVSMLHARVCSGRAQPTPPVTCKTDVLQVAQL